MVTRGNRRGLYAGLAFIGVGFWVGLFASMYFLIDLFWEYGSAGPYLAGKLLEMLLTGLFVLLGFSNVLTALSTFYLSDDLELVLSLPLKRVEFHYSRFLDALVQSSWMMALFGVPVFLAFGIRIGSGWAYYGSLLFAVPSLLVMSTSIGIILATLLVNIFDARRTREMMMLLGVMMVATLFVLVRALRPERLVNTKEMENVAQYIAQMQVPAPVLFPPRWASEVVSSTLLYGSFPWLEAALLVTGALAAASVSRWVTAWGFDQGWSRSQEARSARFYRSTFFDQVALALPRTWRPIVAKELRIFVRDPSQWTQVFMLTGICGVYLVSIHSITQEAQNNPVLVGLKYVMPFFNLGMGGFIMAAIAARFQFTAVSREGRSWWILRAAPILPAVFLRAKSVVGMLPMIFVGLVVVLGSGLMLDHAAWLLAIEAFATTLLAVGISGIAMALGALWPDFRADTAARAATSPAAVFFMVVALVHISVVVSLVAGGAWLYAGLNRDLAAAGVWGVAVALCLVVGWWPLRRAANALWAAGL